MSGIEKIVNLYSKLFYFVTNGTFENYAAVHLLDEAFYLQNIPLVIPVSKILLIALGTLVLSVLVSVIPSVKAGKEKPIETLRKI